MLAAIGHEPVLAFLAGAVLAWLCHSTLAVILLIASFLANGSLDSPAPLSLILGINCGGGLPAVTRHARPAAGRRAACRSPICSAAAPCRLSVLLAFASRIAPS